MFSFSVFLVLFVQIFLFQSVSPAPTPIDELEARHEGHFDSDTTPSPANIIASDFRQKNGLEAQKLNGQFKALKETDGCEDGQQACVQSQFGQCVAGKWVLSPCAAGTTCFALPLVNKPGTSLACDSQSDANARFEAAGVQGGPDGLVSPTNTPSATTSTIPSDPNVDSGEDDCDESDPTPITTGTPDNTDTDDGGDCDEPDPTPGTPDNTDDGDDCEGDTPSSVSLTPATLSSPSASVGTITKTVTGLPTVTGSVVTSSKNAVFTRMTVERRQILTSPSSFPVTATSSPAAAAAVVTLSSAPPSILPIVPTTTSTPTAATPNGVVTPTIAVGRDGIVTVTVVSVSIATVTVTATPDCAASTPTLSNPATTPSPSVAGTVGTGSVSSLVSLFTSSSPIQTVLATPSPTPILFTSLVAAEPSSTSTSSPFGGISFSTQVVTPTPSPTAASSPAENISELLTATLS